MKIKVLGTECPKCNRLYAQVEKAIAEAGQDAQLEKVDQIEDIMSYGVMMTPALVLDEQVKSSGKIPKVEQIVGWINEGREG